MKACPQRVVVVVMVNTPNLPAEYLLILAPLVVGTSVGLLLGIMMHCERYGQKIGRLDGALEGS